MLPEEQIVEPEVVVNEHIKRILADVSTPKNQTNYMRKLDRFTTYLKFISIIKTNHSIYL